MPTSLAERVRSKVQGAGGRSRAILPEHAKLARELTPRQQKGDVTRVLAERFVAMYQRGRNHIETNVKGASNQKAAWNHLGRVQESRMIRDHHDGAYRINGENGLNVQHMSEAICHRLGQVYKKGDRLQEALQLAGRRGGWKDRGLQEHVVMGIGRSQYGRYLDDIVRIGTWEMAESASVAPILAMIGKIQVDCGQQVLASNLVPVDVWKELHPMAENEPTPFFGVGSPLETTLPKRDKIKFAYALKQEAYCMGLDVHLREVMSQGAVQLDRYWAPHIVQTVFGFFPDAASNRWGYVEDGVKFANEYPLPAAGFEDQFPYVNMIYNDEDVARGDDAIFVLMEQLFRGMTDPRTGDPITSVQGALDIIATGPFQVEAILSALQAVVLSVALGGPQNATAEQSRPGRKKWNTAGITDDIWIERYVSEFITQLWPGWTAAQKKEALDRTIIVGNIKQAIVVQDEWPQQEFDMPTAWTEFDREDVWGRKFMQKSGLATLQPQARGVVRGWPTGVAFPGAPTAP